LEAIFKETVQAGYLRQVNAKLVLFWKFCSVNVKKKSLLRVSSCISLFLIV
jgi:hypothetical protein